VQDNPLPAVMGRVCYHPCETSCNRAKLDQAVSIHAVERFLGDYALENRLMPEFELPSGGKRVLIVGAGPSGLSAAYHLTRLGHRVTIREAGPMAGGMMRFGIPKYRLPRDVLDGEIRRIVDMGVELELNTKVEDIEAAFKTDGFDAVFVAVGAHLAKRTEIPAHAAGKILDAVSVLRDMETGAEPPQLGRRVIVYGGGNTAMDVARTAKRLGVDEAMIVYRRSRKEMPAHDFEATEAEEEGVMIHWLRTIKQIDESTFTVEKMVID
jgi:NADPH-dependent glutamate synthase beta subunit-like oxidoreductase